MPKGKKRRAEDSFDHYMRKKWRKWKEKKRRRRERSTSASRGDSTDSRSKSESPPPLRRHRYIRPLDSSSEDEHEGIDNKVTESIHENNQENLDPLVDMGIIDLLGEDPIVEKRYSQEINANLATRYENICTNGLSKDEKKELSSRYLTPRNCSKIEPPELNAEAKPWTVPTTLRRDKAIQYKQAQITTAISCIAKAMTILLSKPEKETDLIKAVNEAGRLMCDLQHTESTYRRMLISSGVDKNLNLQESKIGTYLFGDNLAERIKSSRAITKSANEVKAKKPKSLNLKTPPAYRRPQGVYKRPAAAFNHSFNAAPTGNPQPRRPHPSEQYKGRQPQRYNRNQQY